MEKNIKKTKIKKLRLIAIICAVILFLLGTIIYFSSKNKKIETSAQPMDIDESIEQNIEEVNNVIEEIEENVIEESNTIVNETANTNTNTNNTNKKDRTIPYYIKVNYGAQVVTIYKKDANGDYTVPVKAMVCSTGTATPKSGVYSIPGRWRWGALFGNVYGQYCVKITGNILFHSVPYLRNGDNASLEYWEYDKLGTAASAGCVRLTVADASWIFNNCANGTKVEFYSSSDPGPLGKPSAKKIRSYPDYLKNWDPTDSNPNNPWKTYKEPAKTNTDVKKEKVKNEETNNVKPDTSEKNKVTDSVKPDTSEKNEVTNSVKPDTSEKNKVTDSVKPNTSGKNEMTNNVKQNTLIQNNNENNNIKINKNVVKNET